MTSLTQLPAPQPGTLRAILPTLVHIQAHLDGDLSLDELARRAGLSRFHFHRLFRTAVGETTKSYAHRLRLERAAYRLLLHRDSILDIAIDCGFASHETFTRAFRRRFGTSPRSYRTAGRDRLQHGERSGEGLASGDGFELSKARVVHLAELDLAFRRHVGPYEQVDDELFEEVGRFALDRGWGPGLLFLGIGHDAPGITAPDRLRFDAAVRAPGPFEPTPRIGHQKLAGGSFALVTHIGPYRTLSAAYPEIWTRAAALRVFEVVGLPAVEIYRATWVRASEHIEHTDVHLPVRPTTRKSPGLRAGRP
jgi:AraC family transcriptional regulator